MTLSGMRKRARLAASLCMRGVLGLAVLVTGLLGYNPRSSADFDDTAALRVTSGIDPGSDVSIQVDDTEWAQTILIVDDDANPTSVEPSFTTAREPGLRFFLQGLYNVGFSGVPADDCPAAGALVVGGINLWDTATCGSPTLAGFSPAPDIVIWFTADNGPNTATTTLSVGEVGDLSSYLSAGGNLFLESHEYMVDVDASYAGPPHSNTIPTGGDIPIAHETFMTTYLGIDGYTRTLSSQFNNRYDGVSGDRIGDAGDPISLKNRQRFSFIEPEKNDLSLAAGAFGVLEDNDPAYGGALAAGDNLIVTRTNDGTARVVFAANYLENQENAPDPDNVRTLFERSIAYLADAPSVTVTNDRTGESETVSLTNNGLGSLTGSVGTSAGVGPGAGGDLEIVVSPGDQLVTSYSEASPVAGVVTETTTVVTTTPLAFTDASGTALTTIPVPGSLHVQVTDQDANTSAVAESFALTVTSSSGDSETLTLTETGGSSGVFRSAALATSESDATADNGTLGVADGQTVSASYDYLGAEVTKTFNQTTWDGGTTDSTASIDGSGFDERDDLTAIDADERGYIVNEDPANLATDWVKDNFPPRPNPVIYGPDEQSGAFDEEGVTGQTVLREPSTGDFYMWYGGTDTSFVESAIGLAISAANTTAPVGREFVKQPSPTTYAPVIDIASAPVGSWWECGASHPTVAIDPGIAFGTSGHFVMIFEGVDCGGGGGLERLGRAVSGDGVSWTVDTDPISETVPGAPLEAPFDVVGDVRPSLIIDPVGFPATPYLLWLENSSGIDITFTASLTGLPGTWSVPTPALTIGAAGHWDDVSVGAPSVAYDAAAGLFVMYYEGTSLGCVDPSPSPLFFPAIGRAEAAAPGGPWTKPATPAEQAAYCDEPSDGTLTTYENMVLVPPTSFTEWETAAGNPMLMIDPPDGIDRLYYGSPTELGNGVGLAWNIGSNPDGTLHSNPVDLETAGSTTVGVGPLHLERLGHIITDISARSSDTLADLLYDPAPDVAFPAGPPFVSNDSLLGDFSLVTNGERYLQYRFEIAQDPAPGGAPSLVPPASFVYTDAVEELSFEVYQRPELVASVDALAEGVATDATVRITDVTFTLDPTEQDVTYDFSTAFDETTKTVVDADGGEVLPGDQLDYEIAVHNSASIPLTDVTVSDYVPLGTTYLAGSIFGTGADDSADPQIRWNLGTLDPGQTEIIGFSVIVRDDIGQGSEILNQAFINSAETGVIPSDDPRTPLRRDPTIIPVGAAVAVLLAGAALAAGVGTYWRERRRQGRQRRPDGDGRVNRSRAGKSLAGFMAAVFGASLLAGLVLPAQAQSPGNDMYFEIQDADQNRDPTLVETVLGEVATSSGDAESVTFAETAVDSGVFRATRRAVLDPDQLPGNALLEVEPGDTITLSYEDVTNTSGSPVTRTDSVTVVVSPLYTISVIALQPRLLPSGGIEAEILASPRDVFGIPVADGTAVDFDASVGSVNPVRDTTQQGIAETLFSSSTVVNPSRIDASVATAQSTDTGSVALTTTSSSTTTTTATPAPLNQPPDVVLNEPSGQVNNTPPSTPNNTAVGNHVNNQPTPLQPQPEAPSFYEQIQTFLNQPVVRRAAEITDRWIAPIVAGLSVLNLALATTIGTWYPFLLRIFLEPAQVLFGRGRKPWGVVYNSLTKQPVDLAIVRLRGATNEVISTKVTDRYGRYSFLVQPGRYTITVTKPGYTYPSALLRGTPNDQNFGNLHYGSVIAVTDEQYIDVNIPIDPTEARASAQTVLRRYFKKTAHVVVAYSGLALGLLALIVAHTLLSLALLGLHVLVFALFWRLARGRKKPNWGVTYEHATGTPLSHAVIRIFDGRYNRVLEQQVSDRSGRFGFLVGTSTYYLDAIKSGYQFPAPAKTKRADYVGGMLYTDEPTAITVDIPLAKAEPGQPPISRQVRPLNPQAPRGPIAPDSPSV